MAACAVLLLSRAGDIGGAPSHADMAQRFFGHKAAAHHAGSSRISAMILGNGTPMRDGPREHSESGTTAGMAMSPPSTDAPESPVHGDSAAGAAVLVKVAGGHKSALGKVVLLEGVPLTPQHTVDEQQLQTSC